MIEGRDALLRKRIGVVQILDALDQFGTDEIHAQQQSARKALLQTNVQALEVGTPDRRILLDHAVAEATRAGRNCGKRDSNCAGVVVGPEGIPLAIKPLNGFRHTRVQRCNQRLVASSQRAQIGTRNVIQLADACSTYKRWSQSRLTENTDGCPARNGPVTDSCFSL